MKVIEFSKGLDEEKIKKISEIKNEDKWMRDFRLKSYDTFIKSEMPSFGPKINIDFDDITYYKSTTSKVNDSWNDLSKEVNDEFNELGVKDIEEKYLDGMGVQYESEVIYHNMLK